MKFLLALLYAAPLANAAPTFNKDIAPILHKHCTSCHRPDEVGPFPLITYADAKKRARQIVDVMEDRITPPWKPVAGHGEFKDAWVLSAEQIAAFKAWLEAGKPEGDAKDKPVPPQFPSGWHCGEPDLILTVAKPFKIPAEGPDNTSHIPRRRGVYVRLRQSVGQGG